MDKPKDIENIYLEYLESFYKAEYADRMRLTKKHRKVIDIIMPVDFETFINSFYIPLS